MFVYSNKNLTTALCFILILLSNYDCSVIISTHSVHTNDTEVPLSTICQSPNRIDGFCVPVRTCVGLHTLFKDPMIETIVEAWKCGPKNQNVKNPYVCCEKSHFNSPQLNSSTNQNKLSHSEDTLRSCGVQNLPTRIWGGEPTKEGEFPWMARLIRRDRNGELIFGCTGSLISKHAILTTAHCLNGRGVELLGELYAVSLGDFETECNATTNCMRNKKTYVISTYLTHPLYNKSSKNHDYDIGLIFLRDQVSYTRQILPICLLEQAIETLEYFISGWGKTESGDVSTVKLKTSIPPYSWEQCAERYRRVKVDLTPRQICAGGENGRDSCQGDSGGPLMVFLNNSKWYVAGVVSFGVSCGKAAWPAVYSYVPSYIDWIKKNI